MLTIFDVAFPAVTINYLAVLVTAIVSFVIGMIWFSPYVFGNIWQRGMGWDKVQMEKRKKSMNMTAAMILNFIASFIMIVVLAHLVKYAAPVNFLEAIEVGCWIWIGFIITTVIGGVLWEGKKWSWYFVTIGYHLVNLLVASMILAAWV